MAPSRARGERSQPHVDRGRGLLGGSAFKAVTACFSREYALELYLYYICMTEVRLGLR